MAKNYSLTEATQIIVENEDAAQIAELGKRFPLLVSKLTRLATKAGEELNDLMQFMPENLSANKVNQSIKKALEEDDEDAGDEDFEDDGDDAEEEVPKAKTATKGGKDVKKSVKPAKDAGDDVGNTDYDSMNNAQMYKLLGEMGKRKDCKEKFGDLSHDSMLKYLKKYGQGNVEADDDAEDEVEEAAEEQVSYEGMKAVELYKLCKERKIKAEKQQKAKYYVDLLKKADKEAAQVEEDAEDDDDWDEVEEEEAQAPKKPAKPSNKPAAKSTTKPVAKGKPAKPAVKEEEDDEDWDI